MVKDGENKIWELLAKYLANEVFEAEQRKAETLLHQNENLYKDFIKLMAIYYGKENGNDVDPRQVFKKLNDRINNSRGLMPQSIAKIYSIRFCDF